MIPYLVTLTLSGTKQQSVPRTVWRATDDEAIEAAKRLLRLHRNAYRMHTHRFDQWTVAKPGGNGLPRIIAYGGPPGPTSLDEPSRN